LATKIYLMKGLNKMKNILCFGDSNTFGYDPASGGRYALQERWTGILQKALGEEYRILEEGCNGRTTCFEDPFDPHKNGSLALPVCLESHRPLELVILCLGTNDLKTRFHLSANDIARGMGNLVKTTQQFKYGELFQQPRILIMSPVRVCSGVEKQVLYSFGRESIGISEELPYVYNEIAKMYGCFFFDCGSVARASRIDCIHIDSESHRALATALAEKIKSILG